MSRKWGLDVTGAGLRPWDTRIVFLESRRRWWWNAWREATATELYGFADSADDARQAMWRAIEQAFPWPAPERTDRRPDGTGRSI